MPTNPTLPKTPECKNCGTHKVASFDEGILLPNGSWYCDLCEGRGRHTDELMELAESSLARIAELEGALEVYKDTVDSLIRGHSNLRNMVDFLELQKQRVRAALGEETTDAKD